MTTYLGPRGYTINKSELSAEDLQSVRNELTISPSTQGPSFGPAGQVVKYPAYRESTSKIYLPLYYGLENFGPFHECHLSPGVDINVPFQGSLRDNQVPVVQAYMQSILQNGSVYGGGLLELPCAYGKTVLALNIVSILRKKTFIIVHKEFLMNQWIERIQQFLPTARVGKIQGPVVDIENKDIVIGMLQSLSMKEYPASTFESFGLTIIDEVHHISSEVFSNSLFKLVTRYMLGLSATMNRKDGTTHVFKMFLGDVVFKGKRDEARHVEVRGIPYCVNDPEFNEVARDFRGNVAFSTMISKLCEYNRRSEFILQVLVDLLREEDKCKQVMILAHNRNLLTYLHDAIAQRGIATVGYYVGGMKEAALKASESKKVVIATYAMAAEALDIKTLTTLIMATPKTDIEQSVGRILREKHSQPIVVDIIDAHEPFQNQWSKRKSFYKRENYKILVCKGNYDPDTSKWAVVFDPNKKSCSKKPVATCESSSSDTDEESEVSKFTGKCMLTIKK
jgi:superfamily II DNA or RNA helicase